MAWTALEADVQRALRDLVATLETLGVSYAVVGALALGEYGYRRATVDVDVLLTPDGLEALKRETLGRGYVERVAGGHALRDTRNDVDIDVLLTGAFPGDGKPKPVRFPDPGKIAVRGAQVALLPLPALVELKLASGISAPHRLGPRDPTLATVVISDHGPLGSFAVQRKSPSCGVHT